MISLEPLMRQNFLEYASYVVVDRAIPNLQDGCKPVQRRILYTMSRMDDGKFNKVASVIGETMKFHPHGDASIGAALVTLAHKRYLIETQGNFGNPITGHAAAAARYIECRLTKLAKDTLFNAEVTEFQPSYDGRHKEPVELPSKLPLALLLGTEGIAVGMSTKILPHNLGETLQAQIDCLSGRQFSLLPDFIHGGLMDVSEYDDGRGKLKVRARLEALGDKKIVVKEIPFGTTTESLMASIENAAHKNKIKIAAVNDYTAERVEIEIVLPRGVYAEDVLPQLYAYTDCEVSVQSSMLFIVDRRPREFTVSEVVSELSSRLKEQIKRELEHDLEKLKKLQHWLTLERIFIEHRLYRPLEEIKTEAGLKKSVESSLAPFIAELPLSLTDEDIKRLLQLHIRRISAYDIERQKKQLRQCLADIKLITKKLCFLTETTIAYLQGLFKEYGHQYRRKTAIEEFSSVDRKSVARQSLKVSYDSDSGFFGTHVKGDKYVYNCSEYDFFLVICLDGTYKIVSPEEKVLFSERVLYCAPFDEDQGKKFVVVYRNADKYAFAKRIHIHKFIRGKEYRLIKGAKGRVDNLIEPEVEGVFQLSYVPKKRQIIKTGEFSTEAIPWLSPAARGVRMAPKPVAKLKLVKV